MQGNIVFVDYELSSWKYQNDEYIPSKYLPYILGEKPLPKNSGVVIKSGYVLRNEDYYKGMGSAFGGEWRPSKTEDERLLGKPGEIITTYNKKGYEVKTKIGDDGRATMERHFTDHNQPWAHTNPHDHIINWHDPRPGIPTFVKPHINYPDGAPEYKKFGGIKMSTIIRHNTSEENRFKSISDFEDCMIRGGEVLFEYHNKEFSITHRLDCQTGISQSFMQETEKICKDADEVLEYVIDGIRLRDIITEVEVTDRTI